MDHSTVIRHLKQNGKAKKLDKWVPHKLTTNQKNAWSVCLLLLYTATINNFATWLWHVTKSGFYTNGEDQLSWWTKKQFQSTPKAKLTPKKGQGHCLAICCQYDPLQFPEFWRNHYIWEVYSANRWGALTTAPSDQQEGPNSSPRQHPTAWHKTNASKVEWTGLRSFAPCAIFTRPLANQLPFFMHLDSFLQGKRFHNQEEAENVFQEFIESRSMDFYRNEQTYFSLTKMCWLQWFLFWWIKMYLSLVIMI